MSMQALASAAEAAARAGDIATAGNLVPHIESALSDVIRHLRALQFDSD
jgi:hypothetical protein